MSASFRPPYPTERNPATIQSADLIDTPYQSFDNIDSTLADQCSSYHYDPLGWVLWAFDWGYGDLEGFEGPDTWQREFLQHVGDSVTRNHFDGVNPVSPLRYATASGHGIGKSAITSWIILWIMSTRPRAKGIVTANTSEQLRTKTWAEVGKWRSRCIVGHWFEYNSGRGSMSLYHKSMVESWRVDAQTCREENSEAFAGLHAADSTPFYIFDEASAVPGSVWEVAEGGLTDGEPMIFCFGNPTRNSGRFADCFMNTSRWTTRQIDSRESKLTNKTLIAEWAEDHGEDSDFFRVRVRGEFPNQGDMQFIPNDVVEQAMSREVPPYLGDEPLLCAFDVARGGGDDCRIGFRRGRDARSEKSYRIGYEDSRDSMHVVSKVVLVLERHRPDVIYVDETGVGGPVLDRLKQLGWNAIGVQFGGKADDERHFKNKTAEMGYRFRQWLMDGGCIPDDTQLKKEITSREYGHNDLGQWVLEKKEDVKHRLGHSPDWADQFYMLFAMATIPLLASPRGDLDAAPWAREALLSQRRRDYDPIAQMDIND